VNKSIFPFGGLEKKVRKKSWSETEKFLDFWQN